MFRTALSAAMSLTLGLYSAEVPPPSASDLEAERQRRLQQLNQEISEFQGNLDELRGQERGVLGELEQLETELRLRQKEHQGAAVRLDDVTAAIERHDATLAGIDEAQAQRRRYLAFRLREIYKAGSEQTVHRFLGGRGLGLGWSGLGYASYLSERDRQVLEAFAEDEELSKRERSELEKARDELAAAERELSRRRDGVERMRRQRATALQTIRRDESRHEAALQELLAAAQELGRLAESLGEVAAAPAPDVKKFKGLLEWPTAGRLRSGFGTVVHPEFKTEVPHPGWDIEADFGAEIVSIFGGRVVFSDWMRGYGLTAIVDHGGGLLSIYAHASVLVVEPGEQVSRGQRIGAVGDTGSLSGPFLYFELRVDGKPTDPQRWLLRR
jgi:septal ring factor EnvC (AmiA/AmiB activator)